MWGVVVEGLRWLLIALLGSQAIAFICGIGWWIWSDAIRPRLIAQHEVDRVAEQIIANFPDPEREAFLRHDRAWNDSDGAAQTYWLRVRKSIRCKLSRSRTRIQPPNCTGRSGSTFRPRR